MKPILFIDFDGTLCHDRFWRSLEPTLQEKVQINLFGSKKELIRNWMLGKYTSEEINQMLADELGADYNKLWSTFVNDCKKMAVSQEVLDRIQSLRERYFIVLITDNMDSLDRFTVPALGLDQYFDLIVNSHTEKALKNDENGKSFQKVIEKYQSPLSESILIDNSVSSCKVFEDLGGKSCLVTPEKTLVDWLETV
ncbi:MAG: HAD family hydrolase [Patescibacteria group bacterium]|nr:HAD family hydrolase [Patescibacteria group bacterium]